MKIVPLFYKTLSKMFSYDSETGNLTWLSGIEKGKVAGCTKNSGGYVIVDCFYEGKRRKLYGHRIALCLYHKKDITTHKVCDHQNFNRADNKISNIGLVTHRENATRKRMPRKNRKSMYQGVLKIKFSYGYRYLSLIRVNGKATYGEKRNKAKEAYYDYLQAYYNANGWELMPPKLQKDFVNLSLTFGNPAVS